MANKKDWIGAARLRTLPLALSTVLMGTFLAVNAGHFKWTVFCFTVLTTILLQVLSNFSNDYGDATHGLDDDSRVGPMRSIQSGAINQSQMKKAIVITAICSFISGSLLLYVSGLSLKIYLLFLLIGSFAIWAAIRYTAGSNPYGYRAMGDFFVFLFFGIVGVLGAYFLHGHDIPNAQSVLPASAIGFFSAAVLHLNNMRDAIPDKASGKITMAGLMGPRISKIYHAILLSSAILSLLLFSVWNNAQPIQYVYVAVLFIIIPHLAKVFQTENPSSLDPELKKVALSTFFVSLLFGASLILF